MSENLTDVRTSALGELAEFEAAVFRFGHQVRAFLNDFPAGLPVPASALPRFVNEHPADGGIVFGGASYLHLIMCSADEVEAWAKHLGVPVTRKPYDTGTVSVRAEAILDGLALYVAHTGVDRTGGEPR